MKNGFLIILIFMLGACGQSNNEDKQLEKIATSTTKSIDEEPPKEEIEPIGKGNITTIADGFDVQSVNLWSTTRSDRVTTSHLTNGEEVVILKDEDPYYLIETASGDGRKGYCMKGFVIKSN